MYKKIFNLIYKFLDFLVLIKSVLLKLLMLIFKVGLFEKM